MNHDPLESAKEAGLRYVSDRKPGIRRIGAPQRFRYRDAEGAEVRNPDTLARIRSLVIPPNWKNVWICPHASGHLQVTARDARGRKQYRYHPDYRAVRDQTKYDGLTAFGQMLPRIRRRVNRDLKLPGLPREKVLAAIVRLMDVAHLRVGNREYARDNESYGLTTLRDRHARVRGQAIQFQFIGKSGQPHVVTLDDKRLAAVVKRSQEVPGYELFQYVDEMGGHQAVTSTMVNEYLRSIAGQDVSAKDFRTWHGSVLAAAFLGRCEPAESKAAVKRNVVAAVEDVAARLGNRPATCRKFYMHPELISQYEAGTLAKALGAPAASIRGLSAEESKLLGLLRRASRSRRISRSQKATRSPARSTRGR